MKKNVEIKFSLLLIISIFLHFLVIFSIILPDYKGIIKSEKNKSKGRKVAGLRDIIVNINQDDKRLIDKSTLLSDKDSQAKGYITQKKGNRWLNNSLDFQLRKGDQSRNKSSKLNKKNNKNKEKNYILNSESEILVFLEKKTKKKKFTGNKGIANKVLIPDKNDITMKNAIFYSNKGLFSYNTAKFKNFKYFRRMKDKIAQNWHIPGMANVLFGGYNPVTGAYSTARGYENYMYIPSQKIKLYFLMNRAGDIINVKIVSSNGYRMLNDSCVNAIKFSRNFGKVPEDIKGEIILIPFIFGYYSY